MGIKRWGRGEGFENHHCVPVLQEGEPSNNFLGHEILFYGREILLVSLAKVYINQYENFRRNPRGGNMTFVRVKSRIRDL
jgi:hypothetical protein